MTTTKQKRHSMYFCMYLVTYHLYLVTQLSDLVIECWRLSIVALLIKYRHGMRSFLGFSLSGVQLTLWIYSWPSINSFIYQIRHMWSTILKHAECWISYLQLSTSNVMIQEIYNYERHKIMTLIFLSYGNTVFPCYWLTHCEGYLLDLSLPDSP